VKEELERERALRVAAEANTREVLAAMRDMTASASAEIEARVAEARGEMDRERVAREAITSQPRTDDAETALRSQLAAVRFQHALFLAAAEAGVKTHMIGCAVRAYVNQFDQLDDGTPLVKATMSPDAAAFFSATVRDEIPEIFVDERRKRV